MVANIQQTASPVATIDSPLEGYMRRMFAELMASMARALRDDNMSLAELAALHLCDIRGAMTIGALGAELDLPLPAASRLISGLVKRGLVDRVERAEDRRAKKVTLTEAGRAFIERIAAKRIAEATSAMMQVSGDVSERFLDLYAQMGVDGLTKGPAD